MLCDLHRQAADPRSACVSCRHAADQLVEDLLCSSVRLLVRRKGEEAKQTALSIPLSGVESLVLGL